MRKVSEAVAVFSLAIGVSTVAPASTVYSIDQSSTTPEVMGELSPLSDTVVGTITTDGVIGPVQSTDILGWNLQVNDNLRPAYDYDLTPVNSGIWFDTGDGLVASATTLSFNFSSPGAVFIIQAFDPGFSSGFRYFCFQATTGPCVAGETIVPDYFAVDGVQATGFTGMVPLTGVPEAGTWAMMLAGLSGLGASLRSRRPRATVNV